MQHNWDVTYGWFSWIKSKADGFGFSGVGTVRIDKDQLHLSGKKQWPVILRILIGLILIGIITGILDRIGLVDRLVAISSTSNKFSLESILFGIQSLIVIALVVVLVSKFCRTNKSVIVGTSCIISYGQLKERFSLDLELGESSKTITSRMTFKNEEDALAFEIALKNSYENQ